MNGTIIETKNLTKVYNGKIKAVSEMNLEIKEGEIYGLAGPNGAGKTTTINMLITRIALTGGTATVGGFDIAKNSLAVRKMIGMVPQDFTNPVARKLKPFMAERNCNKLIY